ncbi:MAG: HDOD domain-containing protein [Gammaproteobacteria bacterium]|nr:HDOD domain-containing protein [Gammaproteobacteria bacterium]
MSDQAPLFARQPIYDNQLKLYGYELLFRPVEDIFSNDVDGDAATSQVIINAFTEIDFDAMLGHKPAFVNFTRNWLKETPPFPVDQIVVEVLEDIEVDDALIADIRRLSQQGFSIALDDFVLTEKTEPLLALADIVKMDVLGTTGDCLIETLDTLKEYPLKLLAEKVEDHDMFHKCKELGFHYYQGFFLSKPENVKGKPLQSSQLAILNIISALQRPDITIEEVESLVSQDPALSYKTLKLINSPSIGIQQNVTSVNRAIGLLGLDQIKRWASIISLTKLTSKGDILFLEALFRAKMCEEIAIRGKLREPEMYFTVGLFSMLDVFLDKPISEVLEKLPLAQPLKVAIEHKKGLAGNILNLVLIHQRGQWEKIPWLALKEKVNIDDKIVEDSQLAAIGWSQEIFGAAIS